MKTRFPKLQGFLIKPTKPAKDSKNADDKKKKTINLSNAFVHKGYLIAADGKMVLFFNLKEYLKHFLKLEDGGETATAYAIISSIVENLEGKTLSSEFFNIFSKLQTIIKVDEFKIYVEQKGLYSEYLLGEEFDVEALESFLSNIKKAWDIERSEQGQFCIHGSAISSITNILSAESQNDSLVFERTTDDKAKFCLANKDFVFGICKFSIEAEASITKFGEANDFFDLSI